MQPNFIERSEVKIRLSERKIQFLHSLFFYWCSGEHAFLSMAILPRKNGAEARLKWHSYNASTAKRQTPILNGHPSFVMNQYGIDVSE